MGVRPPEIQIPRIKLPSLGMQFNSQLLRRRTRRTALGEDPDTAARSPSAHQVGLRS
jgi:hypothetical protein